MISNYQEDIKESKVEMQLITTEQFIKIARDIEFLEQNPAGSFVFGKQLGKGAMCKVFEAFDREDSNKNQYACRIIKIKDLKALEKIRI